MPASAAVSSEVFWMMPGAHLPASQVAALLPAVLTPPGEQQVVPIRLPVEQHTRLREWCQENGFSVAGVVRGLVDRFLDTFEPRSGRSSNAQLGNRPVDPPRWAADSTALLDR